MRPTEYVNYLRGAAANAHQPFVSGLCGRIVRGKKPDDFATLTDDPTRLVVMLMDSDGLARLFGKTPHQMLLEIGYRADYIKQKVADGNGFKIVVFPQEAAQPATWDGVFKVAAEVYPDVAACCQKHGADLRTLTKFERLAGEKDGHFLHGFERLAGHKFADADKPGDTRFMTIDKYRASGKNVWELRALLYHTLHLRELFSGDGYTYNEQGRRQLREYLMLNKKVVDISGAVVHDLDVKV